MSETLIWPLFIFITIGDILAVGLAASVSAIGIVFFMILIGRVSDKMSKRKLLVMGALGYFVIWMIRGFLPLTLIDILLLSFMGGLFDSLVHIPLFSYFCDRIRSQNILACVTSRELWLGIGRIVPLILIIALSVQSIFGVLFILAGIASLMLIFFRFGKPTGYVAGNLLKVQKRRKVRPL